MGTLPRRLEDVLEFTGTEAARRNLGSGHEKVANAGLGLLLWGLDNCLARMCASYPWHLVIRSVLFDFVFVVHQIRVLFLTRLAQKCFSAGVPRSDTFAERTHEVFRHHPLGESSRQCAQFCFNRLKLTDCCVGDQAAKAALHHCTNRPVVLLRVVSWPAQSLSVYTLTECGNVTTSIKHFAHGKLLKHLTMRFTYI